MVKTRRDCVAAIALLIAVSPVNAADNSNIKTALYSDAALQGAIGDIAQMPMPELRALTRYLSECEDSPDDPVSKHACFAVREAYEIEFSSGRPLDQLLDATLLIYERPADKPDLDKALNNLERFSQNVAARAERYVTVTTALNNAARARFQSLRSSKK